MTADALFELPAGAVREPPPVEELSADRRRTLRYLRLIQAGRHPFGGLLHEHAAPVDDPHAPGRRCGNCWYRQLLSYHARTYPKCLLGIEAPTDSNPYGHDGRVAHSAASDCRAWWPACRDHSYGDPRLSRDAARNVPEDTP
jgi:hypothetical protein